MSVSLQEARDRYWSKVEEGVICPCCERYGKCYTKRTITSSMATALILIYRYFRRPHNQQWLHVENYLKGMPGLPAAVRGDFHKLRYWGFLEQLVGERADGSNRVGFWRITPEGERFARREISAPRYARVYNNECLSLWGDKIYIDQVKKFNYSELMK